MNTQENNPKLKAIIIEDEKLARDLLKNYLTDYDNINVMAECSDGFQGIKAINEHHPDLVFLDIQMPKLTGFEMLELLDYTPDIIFTTAYDEYAIKAFEHNAVDYLLKPFSKERFRNAITKLISQTKQEKKEQNIKNLAEVEPEEILKRVVVKSRNKINVLPVDTIKYFESQDDYVMIYAENGKFLKQKTMKYFESNLDARQFIRIHRSYIVNVDYIVQLEPYEKDSYVVVLSDKTKLKVSQNGLKNLKEKLNF